METKSKKPLKVFCKAWEVGKVNPFTFHKALDQEMIGSLRGMRLEGLELDVKVLNTVEECQFLIDFLHSSLDCFVTGTVNNADYSHRDWDRIMEKARRAPLLFMPSPKSQFTDLEREIVILALRELALHQKIYLESNPPINGHYHPVAAATKLALDTATRLIEQLDPTLHFGPGVVIYDKVQEDKSSSFQKDLES